MVTDYSLLANSVAVVVLPVLVVGIFSAMKFEMYGLNTLCWITYNEYLVLLAMLGPILIYILVTILYQLDMKFYKLCTRI